ncbi:(2Fe-2S)-binding protein [Cohnella herbarum]|uniref:Ferric siderophore reductase C-terminal domain-containing protein n=1 Tax=Cohnella herbarum TaxID=2728023 RepID=A0A7Z2VRW7_9BACL|nr:(2Fe-2S)-binding protein [Cohnella herbarum]QJD88029.1 hypothetical protein HH215_07135 [Cohnella herbarum]
MMAFAMLPEEMNVLTQHFRLTLEPSLDRRISIPSVSLLDRDKGLELMDKVSTVFETSSKVAVVSLFAKRYGFMSILSGLYAMTMFDKSLNYSIENCHLESSYRDQAWLPKVRLIRWDVSRPVEGCREEWRDQVLRTIFAGNIAKVWRALTKIAPISASVLWENAAIYVYWLYENRIEEGASEAQKSRIRDDFQYLINEAPATLFGETSNPFKKFNSDKIMIPTSDVPLRIRKTCCYYYQTSDEEYCPTCPKRKHEVS